jgi:isopenicillin N synthase-like dioxygenase
MASSVSGTAIDHQMVETLIHAGCVSIPSPPAIIGHLNDVWRLGARFFEAETNLKIACRTDIGEGYRAYASEYTDAPEHLDLVESFSASVAFGTVRTAFPAGPAHDLSESLIAAQRALCQLAEAAASGVFALLGHRSDARFGFLNWSRMQLNHGQLHQMHRDLVHVPHEDGNFLTILAATAAGLEQLNPDGTIRDLWSDDEHLVLIAGEIMTWVTGGAVATGFHRVRRDTQVSERYSAIYFCDPDPATSTHWAPWVDHRALFDHITAGWLRSGVPPVQTTLYSNEETAP